MSLQVSLNSHFNSALLCCRCAFRALHQLLPDDAPATRGAAKAAALAAELTDDDCRLCHNELRNGQTLHKSVRSQRVIAMSTLRIKPLTIRSCCLLVLLLGLSAASELTPHWAPDESVSMMLIACLCCAPSAVSFISTARTRSPHASIRSENARTATKRSELTRKTDGMQRATNLSHMLAASVLLWLSAVGERLSSEHRTAASATEAAHSSGAKAAAAEHAHWIPEAQFVITPSFSTPPLSSVAFLICGRRFGR